jgi:hypothetical protein
MALEEESLRDSRAAGNRGRTAWALQNLASLVFQQGDDERGTALLNESLALLHCSQSWRARLAALVGLRCSRGPSFGGATATRRSSC